MTTEELKQQYNEIFKEKPDKWADIGRDNHAWFMLQKILGRPPATLLDIGCGNGHTIYYFKTKWGDKTKFTGVDLSDEAIAIARRELPDDTWICSEIEEIELPKFDVVTILGVAEHFSNIENKMRYISGLLKDKGVLYLEIPNCLAYSDSYEEGFRKSPKGMQEEWHLRKETWDKLLKDSGYVTFITRVRDNPYIGFVWILQKPQ